MDDGFSNKEVLCEIKEDLRDFREKYDIDQQQRSVELSKRPTRSELWMLLSSAGVVIGLAIRLS